MVHSQVVGGGQNLQIWKVAEKMVNKWSPTTGSPGAFRMNRGTKQFSHTNISMIQNVTMGLGY
jgi:hypothetical protein